MPAKKLFVLHIGLPKTGTTALQNVLSSNRPQLMAQGACYPKSPGPSVHRLVTALASQRRRDPTEKVYRGLDPAASIDQFKARFAAEMQALPPSIDRVILSDERLSFMVRRPDEFAELRHFLSPYAAEIRIVIYLRRQDSLLASLYSQALRHGDLSDPEEFTRNAAKLALYDFEGVIRRWAKAFGEDNIVPRLYENTGSHRFDTSVDFMHLPFIRVANIASKQASGANPSIDEGAQRTLVAIGNLLKEKTGSARIHGPRWKRIADLVTLVGSGKGWELPPGEVSAFMQTFAEGNEIVRARYYPERSTLFAEAEPGSRLRSTGAARSTENLLCQALIAAVDANLGLEERIAQIAAKSAETADDPIRQRASLNRALKLQPDSADVRMKLVALDLSQGRLKSAQGALRSLVKLHGATPDTEALAQRIKEAEKAQASVSEEAGFTEGMDRADQRRQSRQNERAKNSATV